MKHFVGGHGHPPIRCGSTVRCEFCSGKVPEAVAVAHHAMAAAGKFAAEASSPESGSGPGDSAYLGVGFCVVLGWCHGGTARKQWRYTEYDDGVFNEDGLALCVCRAFCTPDGHSITQYRVYDWTRQACDRAERRGSRLGPKPQSIGF